MRILLSTSVLCLALALPGVSSGAPQSGDRLANWQVDGSPLFFAGDYYCPAGATVYFDPNLHGVGGEYEGVPIILDNTMEPFSVVYVPVGGRLLKPYERPRVGNLAGTTGSRTPAFPVALWTEAHQVRQPSDALAACGQWVRPDERLQERLIERPRPEPLNEEFTEGATLPSTSRRSTVRSAALPQSNDGIWIEFDGARWAVSGGAIDFDTSRFTQVGEYQGSPVYRVRGSDVAWEMFVRASPRARLTRYVKIDR